MAQRVGIELSGNACRIVSVVPDAEATCVRRFESLWLNDPETAIRLSRLKGCRVSVVAWAINAEHTRVVVDSASYEEMRTAARTRVALRERRVQDRVSDIAPASPPADASARRALILASAPRAAVDRVLRPLIDAGIRIKSLTTPAGALVSLARLRRSITDPDAAELYVALDESATCLTVVSGGVLIATRGLDWGFRDPTVSRSHPPDRVRVAARLVEDATDFLREMGQTDRVSQVCVCGSMPELRSMCASLTQKVEIEVEPLDSLFGINPNRLPLPEEGFRERTAELRLAWAVATDPRLQLNLFRPRTRQIAALRFARGAVAAGVAVGMGVGLAVQSRWQLPSVNARAEASGPGTQVDQDSDFTGVSPTGPDQTKGSGTPINGALPAGISGRNGASAPNTLRPVPSQGAPASADMATNSPGNATRGVTETVIPFSGQLTSILLSADRAVAIVDDQLVELGSSVRGARVVAISEREVLLRDTAGRLRRLKMAGGAP